MCTVTYIPFGNNIIFSSLRDEDPQRPRAVFHETTHKEGIYGPADPKGGGTWFAANTHGQVVILLNGGFEKHHSSGPYRKSRGLIVNEMIRSQEFHSCWENLQLEGIEPFTLITHHAHTLQQRVWDGQSKHVIHPDASRPQVWSSVTLYDEVARKIRKEKFETWCERQTASKHLDIMDCYRDFNDSENGFLMNRNETVKTLSHTQLTVSGNLAILQYDELDSGKTASFHFNLNRS